MFKVFEKKAENERGSTTSSVLVFSSALLVSLTMLVSQIKSIKDFKKLESRQDSSRRINEAALQVVTQLVNTGLLYYHPSCQKLLPQSKGLIGEKYTISDCIASTDQTLDCDDTGSPGWHYHTAENKAVVDVCVALTQKNKTTESESGTTYSTSSIPVSVTFLKFDKQEFDREVQADFSSNVNAELGENGTPFPDNIDELDPDDEEGDITDPSLAPDAPIQKEKVKRWYAKVKAQRIQEDDSRPQYSSLHAEINLGAEDDANHGLIGKHAASDVCFYMRPKTAEQEGASGTSKDGNVTRKYIGLVDRKADPECEGDGCEVKYSRYKLWDLEPKPDGKQADEFGNDYDWEDLVKDRERYKKHKDKESFEVLDKFLNEKVFNIYRQGYRVGRKNYYKEKVDTISKELGPNENWNSRPIYKDDIKMKVRKTKINVEGIEEKVPVLSVDDFRAGHKVYKKYFVGVMPRYKADEGPYFRYFLMGNKSRPKTWAEVEEKGGKIKFDSDGDIKDGNKDENWLHELREGCKKWGKSKKSKFCTKVNIPYRKHTLRLSRKCVKKERKIPANPKKNPGHANPDNQVPQHLRYADPIVNVSCDPGWVDKVEAIYKKNRGDLGDVEEILQKDKIFDELHFAQIISALEVDDDFLKGKGVWADEDREETDEDDGSKEKVKKRLNKSHHDIFKAAYETYRNTAANNLNGEFENGLITFKSDMDTVHAKDCKKSDHYHPRYVCTAEGCTGYSCSGYDAKGNCTGQYCSSYGCVAGYYEYDTYNDQYYVPDGGRAKEKTVYFYEYENVEDTGAMKTLDHVSHKCAIFYYKAPEFANRCRFNYKTDFKDTDYDKKDYICRNEDGCFDEKTHIRMADGTDRQITHLKKGEFVFNPITLKPARIVKLVIGPEFKPLIQVSVDGRRVDVTQTHPFKTQRGWVQAKALNVGDLLLTSGRGYLPVSSVKIGEPGRMVANLALEGDGTQTDAHYVLADGVVTGDLVIQNLLEARALSPQGQ